MKIVFFGTPGYVLAVLDSIHKELRDKESPIVAVVTQSPKPTGRKQMLSYSAVDKWAHGRKIAIYYDPGDLLKENLKFDLGIIADYGKIIPKEVIELFEKGILNIHFSWLPKYRGASPVQAAIIAGDKEIGVSIFRIDEKLDHGPIVSQFKEKIREDDTFGILKERLFERTIEFLINLIPNYLNGKIRLKEQDHEKATFTRVLTKEDGFIESKILAKALNGQSTKEEWPIGFMKDFVIVPSSENVERFIRAMLTWPGAWTLLQLDTEGLAKRLKILKSHCEDGKLVLDEVQLEGKGPVSWKQFKEGYPEARFAD